MIAGRWIIALIDTALRLVALGFVWGGAALFSLLVFWNWFLLFWVGLVCAVAAFGVSHLILRKPFIQLDAPQSQSQTQTQAPAYAERESRLEKAKRGDNFGEMIALLDDDDRYDIQQRIKQRLLDQIDGADAAEMDSFAELLATPERQKRR